MNEREILSLAARLSEAVRTGEAAQSYRALREEVFADPANAALLTRFETLRRQAQGETLSLGRPNADTESECMKIAEVLQFNGAVREYLQAEYELTELVNRITEQLYQASGLSLGAWGDTHE